MDDIRKNSIKNAFGKAGLELKFAAKPPSFIDVRSGGDSIFFCTVERRGKKAWYSMWPGADENRIEVMDYDKDFRQVVLLVHEPARVFKARAWDRRDKKFRTTEHKVPGAKRKFLLGYDERDLFMAQLPATANCTTVAEAHRCLFNRNVPKDDYIRQGEWFFVKVDAFEAKELDKNLVGVLTKTPLSPSGNPHTCDELIRYPARAFGESDRMYARGRVTHIDHATVELNGWHRVYANTENRTRSPLGVAAQWVD